MVTWVIRLVRMSKDILLKDAMLLQESEQYKAAFLRNATGEPTGPDKKLLKLMGGYTEKLAALEAVEPFENAAVGASSSKSTKRVTPGDLSGDVSKRQFEKQKGLINRPRAHVL